MRINDLMSESTCPHCDGAGTRRRGDGAKMRQYREDRGKSLNSTAHYLGTSSNSLSKIELGRELVSETFVREFMQAVAKAETDLRLRR